MKSEKQVISDKEFGIQMLAATSPTNYKISFKIVSQDANKKYFHSIYLFSFLQWPREDEKHLLNSAAA